jgi:hypothetical protein
MWHPTLTYVASSVLECPSTPDWRFYFLLCIHCYSALYTSYPFAESAIQSLLAFALELKSISPSEADNILEVTLHRKQHQKMAHATGNGDKAGLRLDMSEHEAEAAALLAPKFQGLSLTDHFAGDVLYGSKVQQDSST